MTTKEDCPCYLCIVKAICMQKDITNVLTCKNLQDFLLFNASRTGDNIYMWTLEKDREKRLEETLTILRRYENVKFVTDLHGKVKYFYLEIELTMEYEG